MTTPPRVSIGMPVYNAIRDISRVVDAILAQSMPDFELVVSDNASTDGTSEVLQAFAARDARVRYIRQPTNLGATRNFAFVLEQARCDYFMWAASDDLRSPDFLEVNLAFLESHPDYVASTSPVRFANGRFHERNMGDGSLTGEAPDRIAAMFRAFHANGRFYSLIRREALLDCPYVGRFFLCADWAVVLHLAARGRMNRAGSGWVVLGTEGVSASRDIFRMYRKDWRDWVFPFHELARAAWSFGRGDPWPARVRLAAGIAVLNAKGFLGQFALMLRRRRAAESAG